MAINSRVLGSLRAAVQDFGKKLSGDELRQLVREARARGRGTLSDADKILIGDIFERMSRDGQVTKKAKKAYEYFVSVGELPSRQAIQDSWIGG